jgi:ubiquinone/menaquinone biosynthesis C-methylase UbiE
MPDSFFDFGYARLVDPLLRKLRKSVVEFAGFKAGQSVLDVCCGTGAQTFEYARQGLTATGLDIDPQMIRQALYYQAREPELKPSLIVGDAAKMPFENGIFDAASISLALHEKNAALQDGIVREMKRVVKPGGKLVFLDFSVPLPRSPVGYGVKFIESSVGGEHHRDFLEYQGRGGLTPIIRSHRLCVERERGAVRGAVRLLLVPNTAVCQNTPIS